MMSSHDNTAKAGKATIKAIKKGGWSFDIPSCFIMLLTRVKKMYILVDFHDRKC